MNTSLDTLPAVTKPDSSQKERSRLFAIAGVIYPQNGIERQLGFSGHFMYVSDIDFYGFFNDPFLDAMKCSMAGYLKNNDVDKGVLAFDVFNHRSDISKESVAYSLEKKREIPTEEGSIYLWEGGVLTEKDAGRVRCRTFVADVNCLINPQVFMDPRKFKKP